MRRYNNIERGFRGSRADNEYMLIFPAIDLYGGEAVRLLRGDYDKKTVYSTNPLAVARDFAAAGAEWVHLVDLEGARDGTAPAYELICRIKAETGLRCEVGGGIRDISAVRRYLDAGIDRVILGTAAVTDPDFLREAARLYGEQIAVGVDLRDGYVAIKGWTETTERSALDFCREAERIGVGTLICTDISRDGAMRGTNRELYRMLSEQTGMNIIASGGVSGMDDIHALRALGLYGAIVGRGYYTGDISLEEAIGAAR